MSNPERNKLYGNAAARVSPEDFEPEEIPTELQGLTSQILFDMYDQVSKWGNPYGKTGKAMRVYNPEAGWGIHVSASPFTKIMVVIKIEGGTAKTTQGIFSLKLKVGGVVWDRRLTVEQAREVLDAHDEIAEEAGYIDENGVRLYKGPKN